MLNKIFIVDFEDSFTYNIANVLFPFEESCEVIPHQDFFGQKMDGLWNSPIKRAVILGPGPGHPREYENYFEHIKKLQRLPHIYLMGICLGHQIMALAQGLEVREAGCKIHGGAVPFIFRGQTLLVQKYNSLAVFKEGLEVDSLEYERGVSYQFHPESVGTTHNELFFKDLLAFIEKK